MGSKNRIAKDILPIILHDRQDSQWYVEPFCGGCNTLDKVTGNRIGNDVHYELIEFCKAIANGERPRKQYSEEFYNKVKDHPERYSPKLVGYLGFQLSFGAKWFGGYRKDKIGKRNYPLEAWKNIDKQAPNLKGILFYNLNYWELEIPPNSIIYCDPPYQKTTKYHNEESFDHTKFWNWCRKMVKQGHKVFVSEYSAPIDWVCIWKKDVVTGLDVKTTKIDTEKLFIHESQNSQK